MSNNILERNRRNDGQRVITLEMEITRGRFLISTDTDTKAYYYIKDYLAKISKLRRTVLEILNFFQDQLRGPSPNFGNIFTLIAFC